MTSTLTSMRRLSVRFGATTVDLAVPLSTRLGDLLGSGGFPEGARLVDASGAPLPDDDRIGDTVQDGALLYVVDAVHTPSLTRVTPAGPARTSPGRGAGVAPGPRSPEPSTPTPVGAPAPAADATSHVHVDSASAGARSRTAARRVARGRTATPPGTAGRETVPPVPDSPNTAPTGRRAVVPPTVRAVPPPPPGTTRSPVPLPPGGRTRPGAHVARHGAADTTGAPAADLVPARRAGGTVAVPSPPRVAPPPTGATGRASVTAARGGHRVARDEPEQPTVRRGGPAEVALSPGAFAVPIVLAASTVLLVLLSAATDPLPDWSAWAAGGVLLVAGVLAAVRTGSDAVHRWGRVAGTLAAGSGAFVLATTTDLSVEVAAVCGLVVASAAAMLGRVAAIRQGVFDPWITVAAVGTGALAVDAALAITLSWPAYVGPLLLAGAAPLLMRALPALSLDVPEEQLVDTERLSNTSWSARTGVRRRRRPLRQATVELITMRASGIVAAGFVAVALLVISGYGIAVFSTMPDAVARWALLAEGVLLFGGIGLASRTVRSRFGKTVLRATAAGVTLETGALLARRFDGAGDVALVVILVVVALGVVGVSAALDAGWRSLRLSRIADAAEGFCVVFALPAALLAADVIAVLRQAAS